MLTAIAVVSLALGIGVNTAVYSLFEHLLLRRLPVPAPEQIVNVTAPGPRPGRSTTNDSGGREAIFSYPLFRDLERLGPSAAVPIAGHADFDANIALRGQTTEARGLSSPAATSRHLAWRRPVDGSSPPRMTSRAQRRSWS